MDYLNTARFALKLGCALGLLSVPLIGEVEVAGAELIVRSGSATEILYDLAALPIAVDELKSFLDGADPVVAWASDNGDLWAEADASERPLDLIRSFPIWDAAGVESSGFLATLVKLLYVSQFAGDPDSIKRLESEIAQMEEVIESGNLTGYVLEMAHSEIERKRQRARILRGAMPGNLKLYKANQERIDSVLDRFAAIGE